MELVKKQTSTGTPIVSSAVSGFFFNTECINEEKKINILAARVPLTQADKQIQTEN